MTSPAQLDIQTLLAAGIAAANRWNIRAEHVTFMHIPEGKRDYYLPLGVSLNTERVQLEHFKHANGQGLWMGYSQAYNRLLFSYEVPLDTDAETVL